MKYPRLVVPVFVLLAASCSPSIEGELNGTVYMSPDGGFEWRLPAASKRSELRDDIRMGGALVDVGGRGEVIWQVQQIDKGAHRISRADRNLPLSKRLMFAESEWAESTGQLARPPFERELLTMPDNRQAYMTIRRMGIREWSGLRGLLVFESRSQVFLLEYSDPMLGDPDARSAEAALVEMYSGLVVRD